MNRLASTLLLITLMSGGCVSNPCAMDCHGDVCSYSGNCTGATIPTTTTGGTGATNAGTATGTVSQPDAAASDGATCPLPAKAVAGGAGNDGGPACFAGAALQICTAGGACTSACEPTDYGMTCKGAVTGPIPDPDPSLQCRDVPIPTPSGTLFYCCPCLP